jgi:2-dehydro-3-deoxygluconokinase
MTGLFTFGESLGLLTPPAVGPLRTHGALRLSFGGAESNTAIAVARLGGDATWSGRIASDGLGDLIQTSLRGEGVTVLAVRDGGTTSLMLKDRRSALRTEVRYWRGEGPGSRLHPDDIPADDLRRHRVLHVTGITAALSAGARDAVYAAVEIAKAADVDVSFDVNYRSALWHRATAAPVLRDLAARADILFVGDDELELLTDTDDLEIAAKELSERGPREVIIKRGEEGALLWAEGRHLPISSVAVPVVDTVGAGDAFAGGYLAELLRGAPVAERLGTAVRCGAYAVTVPGDWEAAPTRDDLADLDGEARVVR